MANEEKNHTTELARSKQRPTVDRTVRVLQFYVPQTMAWIVTSIYEMNKGNSELANVYQCVQCGRTYSKIEAARKCVGTVCKDGRE